VFTALALRPLQAMLALVAAGMLVASALVVRPELPWLASAVLAFGLCWGSAIDLDRMLLPDGVTFGLAVAGLAYSALPGSLGLEMSALGCAVGFGASWAIAAAFRHMRGHDGLGGGDVKLLAASGAWLGVLNLPFVVLAASTSAIAVVAVLALVRRKPLGRLERTPFGPFIAFGAWLVWLQG
jgi:leader peptidase (prepilin peptidase) / N-methyltransferase